MTLLLSALAFFVLITGLILIHELGHFFAARRFGVVVEEFGFGLPPRLLTVFKSRGTDFTLNWIPFGGFVRLKGENDPALHPSKGSFAAASIWARCVILVAGVAMNFLLALVLFTGGFAWGQWVPTYATLDEMKAAASRGEIRLEMGILIDAVIADEGAAKAGVQPGSLLLAVNGTPITVPEDVVRLQEGKKTATYTVQLRTTPPQTKTYTVSVKEGKTGVSIRSFPTVLEGVNQPLPRAILLSLSEAKIVMEQTVIGIVHLFGSLASSGKVPQGISGIVGIAQLTNQTVQEGWMMYLRLVALLSLSLAALNILPFPALDGGRLLFVLAEGIRRKPADRSFEVTANTIGFVVLLLLIIVVTFSDVLRLFSNI